MRILAADIGGTKTLLALAEGDGRQWRILAEENFPSAEFDSFESLAAAFVSGLDAKPDAACLGVAGPVSDGGRRASVTNLPWQLEASHLSQALGIPRLRLINDFQAVGYSLEVLGDDDLACLQTGQPQERGVKALIGAGTGLGQGFLVWCGDGYEVQASEGGHVDFAPRDALEIALLEFLLQRWPHVSYERLVSGQGLCNIYDFFLRRLNLAQDPLTGAADRAAAIAAAGMSDRDGAAGQSLSLFARIYGAQAGNFALSTLAEGGVYIAGGIAAKLMPLLEEGGFLHAFQAKGRMTEIVERLPVNVVLNAKAGLLGAMVAAGRLLNTDRIL